LNSGGFSYHDNVTVQILTDINITLHDRVEGGDVDTARLEAKNVRLEQSLGSTEALVANSDDLSIGKLVGLLEAGALGSGLDLLLEVESDVAKLLLDVTDDFTFGSGGESVTTLSEDLHQVIGQITASHVDTRNSVGQRETLVDGDNVGNTVTGVENDTSGTTGGVQGQNGLDGDVEGGCVEGLEHDLGHLLTVGLGVDGSFGQENGVLFGGNAELVVEGVVPDLLHVVPVGDNTVLNGVTECEDTTLGLCLITNVGVLLTHTNHDTAPMLVLLFASLRFKLAIYCVYGQNDPEKKGGLFTHGDGDDRQWRLFEFCQLFHPRIQGCSQAKEGKAIRRKGWWDGGFRKGGVSDSVGFDLRKTARGASSPAKPALHIPELHHKSLVS
jgi:hypothetical protein